MGDSNSASSDRRAFLTGRAALKQIEAAGGAVADSLLEASAERTVPRAHETVRLETSAMACRWEVVFNPGPPRQVMLASQALDLLHELEEQLTVYRDSSELMRINRQAAQSPQVVEEGLFQLLQRCRHWAELTEGAFDPTSGPLITLWRDCRLQGQIPSQEDVTRSLSRVGIRHLQFDGDSCTVSFPDPGFRIDLGAVGKGYAIDRIVSELCQGGVGDFLVHGGHSSLYAAGDHGGYGGWPVGIRNPLFTEQRYATLLLQNEGMSTSGSNIQFFRHGGRRYGHILDPRTGWPAHSPDRPVLAEGEVTREPDLHLERDESRNALLSVTVLAPTAAEADALSTAFYVMGLEKAREYCHNHSQVSAILIPSPTRGRVLSPIVCNLPPDRLFFEASAVERPSTEGTVTAHLR